MIQIKQRWIGPGFNCRFRSIRLFRRYDERLMTDAINYSAQELLRDGSKVEIRALRQEDEAIMLAAIERPVRNHCSVAFPL